VTSKAFDVFAMTRKLTDAWLSGDVLDNRAAVLKSLSSPQDGGKGKDQRRLTVGWIIANGRGGWHRLDAVLRRHLPGIVAEESIEKVIGCETIREPLVVLRLGKAGVRASDFSVSYGDQLRIGDAGKGFTLIDLRHVRGLLPVLRAMKKPNASPLREAKRALQAKRLGREADECDAELATVVVDATDDEIRYAKRCADAARESSAKA